MQFKTRPAVIHAQGHHSYKPQWPRIRDAYFMTPPSRELMPPNLTILTCNNGHSAMGRFEQSLHHMGLACMVAGRGIDPWVNSRDKPRVIVEAVKAITTEYVMYADSRDVILIQPPQTVLERFQNDFPCDLLFGGDLLNYPPDFALRRYEDRLAGGEVSRFRYLNAGTWIGRTRFVAEFFTAACKRPPLAAAPTSEQGILRQLLPEYEGRIGIDYRCRIFLNLGFIGSREDRIQLLSSPCA